jgi:hypothetical protein
MCAAVCPCVCLQVLRATARLSTTILYIPLMTSVVEVFNCRGTWAATGWTCFAGPHSVLCILAGTVAVCFSFFAFVGAFTALPAGACGWHCVARTWAARDLNLVPP